MRRATTSQIARWTLALLILWGASAQSFSAVACALGACPHGCGMATPDGVPASSQPPAAQEGCCAKPTPAAAAEVVGGSTSSDSACKCGIVSANEPVAFSVQAFPPSPLSAAILAPPPVSVLEIAPSPADERILFYADPSPPIVPWHPDFGRAPPSA